jgi:hypothetical protein
MNYVARGNIILKSKYYLEIKKNSRTEEEE